MNEPDLEIGDDPMLCHLCDQDFAGSEIVEHLRVEHGGGVSVVSPDARQLADALETLARDSLDSSVEEVRRRDDDGQITAAFQTLLSALDALEQAGGGQAESGGTAELSPVVKALEQRDEARERVRQADRAWADTLDERDRMAEALRQFLAVWDGYDPSGDGDFDRALTIARSALDGANQA